MTTPAQRIALYLLFLLGAPVACLWLFLTQPSLAHNVRSQAAVDPERLKAHVRILSETFYPRSYSEPKNLDRCRTYIGDALRRSGATTVEQFYQDSARDTYANVLALYPGPEKGRIVVGAHYDACGPTHGADDNASGVAGLLELATLLRNAHLRHTVELVAYSTEEPPFFGTPGMGSARHAQVLHDRGEPVLAMLALEMIGFFDDQTGSQSFPFPLLRLFYPTRGNFIAVVGNTSQRALIARVKRAMRGATPLAVHSVSAPTFVPGIDFSDHRSYWAYGVPAVMVTDTAFLRNANYHEVEDTCDRLDYSRMAHVVAGVFEAVCAIDAQ